MLNFEMGRGITAKANDVHSYYKALPALKCPAGMVGKTTNAIKVLTRYNRNNSYKRSI